MSYAFEDQITVCYGSLNLNDPFYQKGINTYMYGVRENIQELGLPGFVFEVETIILIRSMHSP